MIGWVYGISIAWIVVSGIVYAIPEPPLRTPCRKRPCLYIYRNTALLVISWYCLFTATAMILSKLSNQPVVVDENGNDTDEDDDEQVYAVAAVISVLLVLVLVGISLLFRCLRCCGNCNPMSCLFANTNDQTFEEQVFATIITYFLSALLTNYLTSPSVASTLSTSNAAAWLGIIFGTAIVIQLLAWCLGRFAAEVFFSISVSITLTFSVAYVAYPNVGWIHISNASNNWLLLSILGLTAIHLLYTLLVIGCDVYHLRRDENENEAPSEEMALLSIDADREDRQRMHHAESTLDSQP